MAKNKISKTTDVSTSDGWQKVLNSSVAFLGVKLLVGTVSTVLLYNVFSASTIVLIKQVSLLQQLPSLFSFGIKNKVHDRVIAGENQTSLFSNMIIMKLIAYIISIGLILLARESVSSIQVSNRLLLLFVVLIGFQVCNDIFYSVFFSRGKLTYLINLMTLKTFSMPFIFYFFGERYQFSAWISGMISFEIIQSILLYYFGARNTSIFSYREFDFPKILNLIKGSFIHDLNSRLGLIFELYLFFIFAAQTNIFQAALLSFIIRVSQTMTNVIGQTIQKKFLYDLIGHAVQKIQVSSNIKRMDKLISFYFGCCFSILLCITIVFSGVTYLFIDKFSDFAIFLMFCLPLTLLRLASLCLGRILLCKDASGFLILALISNAIIYILGIFIISRFATNALDVCFIMSCMAILRCCAYYFLCINLIGGNLSIVCFGGIIVHAITVAFALITLAEKDTQILKFGPELISILFVTVAVSMYFVPKCLIFLISIYFDKREEFLK